LFPSTEVQHILWESMAKCTICGAFFGNRRQMGTHRRVCAPVINEPQEQDQYEPPIGTAVPIPRPERELIPLAQRPSATQWDGDDDAVYRISPAPTGTAYRDLREFQSMWKQYVDRVRKCCSREFWQTMSTVHEETANTRDKVLRVVKKLLGNPCHWPNSTRGLGKVVQRQAGTFWSNVTESHVIDLRQYGIPSCPSVTFSFIDPLFVWTQCCNALHSSGYRLHWKPKVLLHPQTQLPAYGAGIQYGLLLRSAAASVPQGGKPALISLSWDGGNTGFGKRSTTPICIQVMNVNSASLKGVALLGYMPHVEVPDARSDDKVVGLARWHVQQKVVGLLLKAIEECAQEGFLCTIGDSTMRLYPRLGALALDSPERKKYFGLRSYRACGICRFRSGKIHYIYALLTTYMLSKEHIWVIHAWCICYIYDVFPTHRSSLHICTIDNIYVLQNNIYGSSMNAVFATYMMYFLHTCSGRSCARVGTRHNDQSISDLYQEANANAHGLVAKRNRKRSREKLFRHGFKYEEQCQLLKNVRHSLVRVEKYPDTLYGGLIRYERMHVYFINYTTYLLDILAKCVPQGHVETVASTVRQCHQFRDPITGVPHPRLHSVLKMTHMTAERRVRAIFYWAHVMGTHANVIITPCRVHAQVAVSTLQLLLIATRGHRAYTLTELQTIYLDVGTQFFRSLELMSEILETVRIQEMTARHQQNPDRYHAPRPFKRTKR